MRKAGEGSALGTRTPAGTVACCPRVWSGEGNGVRLVSSEPAGEGPFPTRPSLSPLALQSQGEPHAGLPAHHSGSDGGPASGLMRPIEAVTRERVYGGAVQGRTYEHVWFVST